MSLLTKRLWNLATLARTTVCTRRSATSQTVFRHKKSQKCQSSAVHSIFSSRTQHRSYSNSKIGGVHQRTLTREWINIGLELSTQGRYSEALEAFNKVLADDNTNTIALTSKALAYLELNKFDVALECCERVLELDESSVFALKAAGAARCNLGRYEEAMENFKQARKLEPNVVAKYFWEDVSTYMRNCGPSIIGFWHHALKDFPTEPHLYLLIANSYLTAGNFTGAKEYASRAVEMDPTYAQYQLAISQAEFGLENWKAAALALDNVIGLGTINHMEHVWLGKVEAEQHLGNYEEMERVLYQAFERSETTEFLLQKAVDVAKKYYADNQTERAIKFLEKIVSYKSNTFDDAVHMLTSIYVDVDRKHDAVTLLRRLHEKHPSNTILMYNLAVFLEPAEAFPYLEQVVQSVDVVPTMWKALGEVYYRLKQYEKAIDALDKGMVADDSLFWHRIKAECHSHLRQWDKEYQAMRRVYDLIPDGPAEYLYIRGEYEKALLLVDEAIAKQPDASKFSSRATLLKEMGRQEEALEAIDKAAELEPDPFQIYQKIDILGTLSRFDEAYALVKQAEATLSESVDEKYVLHNLLLSVLLRRQGKYEESLSCANKAIENIHVLPAHLFRFQSWVEKAKVLEEMKRTDEAIATYEYALSIFPEEPHSLLHLAKLYRARGRDSDVRALLPRLSAITADSESLRKEVAEIVRQYGTIYL